MAEFGIISGQPKRTTTVIEAGKPVGYQQLSVSSTAVGLTLPAGANRAVIIPNYDGAIRWRDDGTVPTATVGMPLEVGAAIILDSAESLTAFKAIAQAADTKLNIAYYQKL